MPKLDVNSGKKKEEKVKEEKWCFHKKNT
jgi:hypothetical protein